MRGYRAALIFVLAPWGQLPGQRIEPVGVHTQTVEWHFPREPSASPPARSTRVAVGIVVGGVIGAAVAYAIETRGGACHFDQSRGNCGFGIPFAVLIGGASGALAGGVIGALSARASSDHRLSKHDDG